jgi:hypothetical protein
VTDPTREFVGLGTVLDAPPVHWTAAAFRPWVQLEQFLPVQWQHDIVISPHGVTREIGKVTQTALIDEGTTPPALLVRGHFYPGPVGDAVLDGVRDYRPGERRWGLSLGANVWHDEDGDVELAAPYEISVTLSPAYEDALVLGVGQQAEVVWDLLAPRHVPRTRTAT